MSKHLRVLVVDDSEDDALLVLRELKRGGYTPAYGRVDTTAAMKAALESQSWDIVISDHNMPHFSAPGALELLHDSGLDLPFVIVSGAIGEELAVATMKAGAHDFIIKNNLARLVPVVERELREAGERRSRRNAQEETRRLQAELEEANRKLEQRVKELTALNQKFQEHLSKQFGVAEAYQEVVAELERLAREASTLAQRARAHPVPDAGEVPGFVPHGSGAGEEGIRFLG